MSMYFSQKESAFQSGSKESELRLFLEALEVKFPLEGRKIRDGYLVTDLDEASGALFHAADKKSVLLSYAISGTYYPLCIFFIEERTHRFGHSTLVLNSYSAGESVLNEIHSAAKHFFAWPAEELMASLHPSWKYAELSGLVDRRIYWDQKLSDEYCPAHLLENRINNISVPIFPSVYNFNTPYFKNLFDIALSDLKKANKILVMGCGAGLEAAILAEETLRQVDAVDINPLAVLNTKVVAAALGRENYVHAWQSDLFSNVHEKYDVILFNAPLAVFDSRDPDRNRFDCGGEIMRRLLNDLPAFLNKGGRLFVMSHANLDAHLPDSLQYYVRKIFSAVIDVAILEVVNKRDYYSPLEIAYSDIEESSENVEN